MLARASRLVRSTCSVGRRNGVEGNPYLYALRLTSPTSSIEHVRFIFSMPFTKLVASRQASLESTLSQTDTNSGWTDLVCAPAYRRHQRFRSLFRETPKTRNGIAHARSYRLQSELHRPAISRSLTRSRLRSPLEGIPRQINLIPRLPVADGSSVLSPKARHSAPKTPPLRSAIAFSWPS
jgi:hypothetical protein